MRFGNTSLILGCCCHAKLLCILQAELLSRQLSGEDCFRVSVELVDRAYMCIYSQLRTKGRAMGPFHLPWLTFGALIVIAGSIILAIVWSIWGIKDGEDQ